MTTTVTNYLSSTSTTQLLKKYKTYHLDGQKIRQVKQTINWTGMLLDSLQCLVIAQIYMQLQ